MAARVMLLYLLSGFTAAVSLAIYLNRWSQEFSEKENSVSQKHPHILGDKVWPEFKVGWRLALATIIGFLGSACGTVGGVGGGGIFVPTLNVVVGFDTKSAAALSKCMIMGASASSVWYNLRIAHPTRSAPIISYSLSLLFQPMLILGITIGVSLSVVFPYWLVTLLTIILFMGTSSRSFMKGVKMWKEETIFQDQVSRASSFSEEGKLEEPLMPTAGMTKLQLMCFNLRWKHLSLLAIVWLSFLLLQIVKNSVPVCSFWFWALFNLQFPIALAVFFTEAVKIYRSGSDSDLACESSIDWTVTNLGLCGFCSILGGVVGGLLGSGGGFILGPLLLEIGVIPQVASATATFVMLFSSSLSVVQFYLLKRFPIPHALYLTSVSIIAGFWGQYVVRKVVAILGRASIIVFVLSSVIFTSAAIMGVVGIATSVEMIKQHAFMGFLDFCTNR